MSKSLMLGVANTSWIVCCSVLSGLVFNWGHLPAIATDADLVTTRVAQATLAMSVNRPILKTGSQGEAVSELQAALKLLGYFTDTVDGVYRESTVIAVSRFQQASGLTADGIVGPATWTRLFPGTPSAGTPSPTAANNSPSTPSAGTPPPTSSNNPASTFPVPSAIPTTTSSASVTVRVPPPQAAAQPSPANRTRPGNPTAATGANSSPAAKPQITAVALPILRKGMQGPAVAQLQERLRGLGFFRGTADGVFGPATQAAVKAAQENFRLVPDGIVGSATWSALLR